MLLVDDDQAQLLEPHVSLHERVRADDEGDRARFDLRELLAPCRAGRGTGEQRDAKPRRVQQPRDVLEMLLGEDFSPAP